MALTLCVVFCVGCLGPHRTQSPGITAANNPASGFNWHGGVGAVNNPPNDCVNVPQAPKGTKSDGAVKGVAPQTVAFRTENLDSNQKYNIGESDLKNFSGPVTYILLPPNSVIYRVIGEGGDPIGRWWTSYPPPLKQADWRWRLAVLAEWNGASCVAKYRVGENGLAAWIGIAAPKNDGAKGWYLGGGGLQIFVPSPKDEIENQGIEYAHSPWAR